MHWMPMQSIDSGKHKVRLTAGNGTCIRPARCKLLKVPRSRRRLRSFRALAGAVM